MNLHHLPCAIVGDPRCNCVMCERNRNVFADREAERILAMSRSEVQAELAREGIDLTEAKQELNRIFGKAGEPPTTCQNYLRNLGGPWPRSCPTCGLGGPCKYGIEDNDNRD